ncbi:hypothetical protein [Prevotella sp. 10(H)]|uniref:hypothetical protein n=1 Tax=Prevotella sp. 10(H) TaxID=1158294 RepID=UPI0004A6CD3F|nr:hypothetical protein [Prevotella sp. 10(H)]
MNTEDKDKILTDKEREEITHQDADQVFGDNNHATRIKASERNEDETDEDPARRTRDILKEARETREKLNRQSNEVRDYGLDARETPLS